MKTYAQAAIILAELHRSDFGGATNRRFLIGYDGLQQILQSWEFDLHQLQRTMHDIGFYLIELPECSERTFAVIEAKTVDRWRRVPRRLLKQT